MPAAVGLLVLVAMLLGKRPVTATQTSKPHLSSPIVSRRTTAKPSAKRVRRVACSSQSVDQEEIRRLLGSAYLRPEYEGYTDEHVSVIWAVALPAAETSHNSSSNSQLVGLSPYLRCIAAFACTAYTWIYSDTSWCDQFLRYADASIFNYHTEQLPLP